MAGNTQWVGDGAESVWLLDAEWSPDSRAWIVMGRPWTDRKPGDPILLGCANGEADWDAATDSSGNGWVVWQQDDMPESRIFTRRILSGSWGPAEQVSSGGDSQPRIVPDEYGNVWILWYRLTTSEIWMCRMGQRSGQQTLVAKHASSGPLNVLVRHGRIFLTYGRSTPGDPLMAAEGTELGGFGEPVQV